MENRKTLYPEAFAQKMEAKLGFEKAQVEHSALLEDGLQLLAVGKVNPPDFKFESVL